MENTNHAIYVTQPSMPPINEFVQYISKIWEKKQLTNGGQFHQQLENELIEYLGVKHISLFSNGTLALITALQALRITGEVITTPFSFVATTHSLWWNGIKPVFVDIENQNCNINPDKIEAAITPKTTAILAVHVYGNPCSVEKIQKIADTYGLKVIYDAAHAFGVKKQNNSILNFGDLSVLSFHATKVFNTFEGGAIICHSEQMKKRIDLLKNFGYEGEENVIEPGINAKMNEIQSAFGLLQLNYINDNIQKRRKLAFNYRENLKEVLGINFLNEIDNVSHNYSYFPIFIDKLLYGKSRNDLYEYLKTKNIFSRKYFYPLISEFSTYSGHESSRTNNLPVANKMSNQVLCLPIYPDLLVEDVNRISEIIKDKSWRI